MRFVLVFTILCLLGAMTAANLWHWVGQREQQRVDSGLRAAELGAKLAFAENLHKEKFGAYTRDFSRLGAILGEEMPCPLEQANTILACTGYQYRVQDGLLIARWQHNPQVYLAFGLADGAIDCSHALPALQKEPICSPLE